METSSGLDCSGPVRLSGPADLLDSDVNCGEDFEDKITLASAFQGRQDVLPVPAHRAAGTGHQPTWRRVSAVELRTEGEQTSEHQDHAQKGQDELEGK